MARHLTWVLPLLAVPVIFVCGTFLAGVLSVIVDSASVSRVPIVVSFVGMAVSIAFSVVAAVKVHARSRPPRPGFYKSLAERDAARLGLTPEEYGVYKGSVGSAVEPINSATGLLVMSITVSVIMAVALVAAGLGLAQNAGLIEGKHPFDPDPVEWFFMATACIFPVWSWRYYVVERRAQKLRVSRGLPRNVK